MSLDVVFTPFLSEEIMKNKFIEKTISVLTVFLLLFMCCGCFKKNVDIEVSENKVVLEVGGEETVTIDNFNKLKDVKVDIDDDIADISVDDGKITISGTEKGSTIINVTASNSKDEVFIKVKVEEPEEVAVDTDDASEEAEEVPSEPEVQTMGQIEVDSNEMEIGLNYRVGTYFHTNISNYDRSWTNVSVSKSQDGIAAAWIDDNDPSQIDISPIAQGVVTLTVTADGMEPADIKVAVVKGVGKIGEPDSHWSSSAGCQYGGRLECYSTYWDVWTLEDFYLGTGRQSENSLVFYTPENLFGYYSEYRVNGGLRRDVSIYLGLNESSEQVDRPDSYEEYLELYNEDERLREGGFDDSEEGYEQYLEFLDEYFEYVTGSDYPEDYFDGFNWELIDTGYYAPDGESPLYFAKRTCPNDPNGDTETYCIYFEYEDTVHGMTNYVTVDFDKFSWDRLVKDAKTIHISQEQAEMEVIVNSASRIFNYVANPRSASED